MMWLTHRECIKVFIYLYFHPFFAIFYLRTKKKEHPTHIKHPNPFAAAAAVQFHSPQNCFLNVECINESVVQHN